MHFVIMGCGRVGAHLATDLAKRGHSVAIIDQNPRAFSRLPANFPGQQVTGVGFERDVLRQAGITDAAGFAAVSNGDNSNIIAARVVRETFNVTRVVTRIYDSTRAEIYDKLGIEVVAPVPWTARHILHQLIALGPHIEHVDRATGAAMFYVDVHPSWLGSPIRVIEREAGARVAYLTRELSLVLPRDASVLEDGDELRLIAHIDDAEAIQRILNHPIKDETR